MNSVAKVQTTDKDVNQLQSNILPPLNTLLTNKIVNGALLANVALTSGSNTINTTLGRELIGWIPIRWHGAYQTVYDMQDSNSNPDKTLILVSAGSVTVDLWVF